MLSTICINQLVGGYHKLCNLICWATRWHSYTVRNQWPQNRSLRYCVNKTYFQNSWGHSNVPWLVWMLSKVLGFLEIQQIKFSSLAFKILMRAWKFCRAVQIWIVITIITEMFPKHFWGSFADVNNTCVVVVVHKFKDKANSKRPLSKGNNWNYTFTLLSWKHVSNSMTV